MLCMLAVILLISIAESLYTVVPYKRKVHDILLVLLRSVDLFYSSFLL